MDTAVDHGAQRPVVLLVEDEALLRGATSEFLEMAGCVVIEAKTASEAIATLESGISVDVVFSDVSLAGGMNGLALASRVRARRPGLPVVLTSGHGGPVKQLAVELVGAERFLPKPYHLEEVAERLRGAARNRRSNGRSPH